jgi:signal transduction histidine kinase
VEARSPARDGRGRARPGWKRRSFGRCGPLVVGLFALAFGILTLRSAHHDPAESFAGTSTLGAVAELGAGWSLIAAGLLFWVRHPRNLFGALVTAAGLAWFLPEWSNPGAGTAFGFTAGLVGFVACVPLVGHAGLAYPTGRLRSAVERATVAVAYAGALVFLGLLPATVFDPRTAGCLCPRNLVLVDGDSSLYGAFTRYGLWVGLGWIAALGVLVLWRLRPSRTTALAEAPVIAPAGLYLAFVAWDFQHSLGRGFLTNDGFDIREWRLEAAALTALALGVGWGLLRERRARAAVAQLVVELGRSPRPGAVRDALADALGDPALELVYRRPGTDDFVDADGLPVTLEMATGRAVTPLQRGNTPVAALVHDARLLDQPGLVQEVIAAGALAVENEQLQAEVSAQLEDLRASRARIVETGDAERQRLERDLHDGAQQRIVALSLGLRLLRSQLGAGASHAAEARIGAAEEELRRGLAELRELAHGIYPAVLADEGLGAALETLAEQSDAFIELESVPDERYPTPVENAAYFMVAEAIKGSQEASVSVECRDERLVIQVRRDGAGHPDWTTRLVEIGDRVGALDGRLETTEGELRAEIPCT